MSAQPMEPPLGQHVTESVSPLGASAAEPERIDALEPTGDHGEAEPVRAEAVRAEAVEVRRNAAVSAVVGAAAAAVAIAYLWRAAGSGAVLDWVLCGLMAGLAGVFLRGLFDARTPLLVVDELGVRIRLAEHWRGLPWEAIDNVVVTPRRGIRRDGRLVIRLHHVQRAIEGLEGRARRHAQLNQKLYGA